MKGSIIPFRALSVLIAAALIAGLLAGCGAAKETPQAGATTLPVAQEATKAPAATGPKIFRDGSLLSEDLSGLDPQKEMSLAMYGVARNIYSTLVRLSYEGDLAVKPDLAEKWDISPDGKVYTFHLRQGIKFHTGEEVTADDVKYTFERLYDPALASPAQMFGVFIVGRQDKIDGKATEVSGIKVVDKYTVEFDLEQPYGAFVAEMVTPALAILCKAQVEKWGQDYLVHPSGTGPFKLKEWVRGEKLVLEANKDYYEGAPKIDEVQIIIVEDEATGMLKFENGELDAYGVPTADLDRLSADPKWKDQIVRVPALDTYYLQLNNFTKGLDDVRVRQAIAYAIDRQSILDKIVKTGKLAYTVLPPGMLCYNPDITHYDYDPAKAKALLKEAGYENGLKISLVQRSQSDVVDAIIAQLAEVGITVEQQMVERSAFWDMVYKGQTDAYYLSWWADFADPHNFFANTLLSQPETPESKNMYINPKVDELINQAATTTDEAARCKMYHEVEQIAINQDAQRVWMWHLETLRIIQPWVKGYYLQPTEVVFYYPIEVSDH